MEVVLKMAVGFFVRPCCSEGRRRYMVRMGAGYKDSLVFWTTKRRMSR